MKWIYHILLTLWTLTPTLAYSQQEHTTDDARPSSNENITPREHKADGDGIKSIEHNKKVSTLSSSIDSLIAHQLPEGSNVGIAIFDLTVGKSIYTYQPHHLSRPASTMKLLTTITALAQPTGVAPFATEVWYKGVVEQDTLKGDLYVVGGFDPEFDDQALDSLVNMVSRSRFSVITGRVLGDVSMKDSLYWGSGWAWDDAPSTFQPHLSPLMLNKGTVTITAKAANRGEPATLECVPQSSYYTVSNQTMSKSASARKFEVTRDWLNHSNHIIVKGNVQNRRKGAVGIYSSERFFMHTFVERLRAKGVECNEEYTFGELQKDTLSVRIAVYETPAQPVIDEIMKESDNLNAEALLCQLGAATTGKNRISAQQGIDAIYLLIEQLGEKKEKYKLADGCGLSNYNYVSPHLLVEFLRFAYSRTNIFQPLYKALPIGGVDGTLKYRMQKGTPSHRNVHAKTGSFTAINTLAGYIHTARGHEVAFAIMNQNCLSAAKARAFQDAVCDVVVRGW